MANNLIPKIEDGDLEKLSRLSSINTEDMTVKGLQEFREVTMNVMDSFSYTMVEMLSQSENMDNSGVGTSHKSLCNRHNINHQKAIKYLRSVGYIDDSNRLTQNGFLGLNHIHPDSELKNTWRPVLFDNDGMGLYWNESSEYFKEIWDRVMLNTPDIFNDTLKNNGSPLKMVSHFLKQNNINVELSNTKA